MGTNEGGRRGIQCISPLVIVACAVFGGVVSVLQEPMTKLIWLLIKSGHGPEARFMQHFVQEPDLAFFLGACGIGVFLSVLFSGPGDRRLGCESDRKKTALVLAGAVGYVATVMLVRVHAMYAIDGWGMVLEAFWGSKSTSEVPLYYLWRMSIAKASIGVAIVWLVATRLRRWTQGVASAVAIGAVLLVNWLACGLLREFPLIISETTGLVLCLAGQALFHRQGEKGKEGRLKQ